MDTLIFENCHLFDGVGDGFQEGMSVAVEGALIREVSDHPIKLAGAARIDCSQRYLLPGLIDAHFHAYSPTLDVQRLDRMPKPLLVSHAAKHLEGAAQRGFTTVRDPGGGDVGLALAIDAGLIAGPRFLYGGKALSQTGGHGDMRPGTEDELCNCGYSGVITQVTDGPDQVRKAAREELRRGAHHIKVMISGGVLSPSDPIWMPQFTDEELRAAVEEAETRRKYVAAHCHTDDGAQRCVELGIRSIEHGTHVTPETANKIAKAGCYVVPTLSICKLLADRGEQVGLTKEMLDKANGVLERTRTSIEACERAGVKLGLGTDIFGTSFHEAQSSELELRAETSKPIDVLRSATSVNAEILQRAHDLGQVKSGFLADLIVLEENPLDDLSVFKRYRETMPIVVRDGRFLRNTLQGR